MPLPVFEFGSFRLDCGRFELFRDSRSLRLERKPMELLILLASRGGQLVPRAEIAQCLWSSEIFVDTEHGINTAIRKIRQVLRDDPEQPRFVQTVPGMGYRFIAPIHTLPSPQHNETNSAEATIPGIGNSPEVPMLVSPATTPAARAFAPAHRRMWVVAASPVALVVLILALTFWYLRRPLPPPRITEYVKITRDGHEKLLGGTDGSRIYFTQFQPNSLNQVGVAGGKLCRSRLRFGASFGCSTSRRMVPIFWLLQASQGAAETRCGLCGCWEEHPTA